MISINKRLQVLRANAVGDNDSFSNNASQWGLLAAVTALVWALSSGVLAQEEPQAQEEPESGQGALQEEVAQVAARLQVLEEQFAAQTVALSRQFEDLNQVNVGVAETFTRLDGQLATLATQLSELRGQVRGLEQRATGQSVSPSAFERLQAMVQQLQANQSQFTQALEATRLVAARGGDTSAFTRSEIDYLLRMAQHQLQYQLRAGGVENATAALATANERLAALDDPALTAVAAAIANDIAALEAVEGVDMAGISERLRELQEQAAALPFTTESDYASRVAEVEPAATTTPEGPWWQQVVAAIERAPAILQVRRRSGEGAQVTPEQADFLRQNLRLQLATAQQAAVAGRSEAFADAIAAATSIVTEYGDSSSDAVSRFQQALSELEGTDLTLDVPNIASTVELFQSVTAQRGVAP